MAAKPAAASIKSAAVAPPVVSAGNHDLLGLSVGAPVPVAHSRSEPGEDPSVYICISLYTFNARKVFN